MRKLTLLALITGALTFSTAMAGDPAAGKARAGVCAGCHGVNGQSAQAMWPNLAGQSGTYIANQLKAFKDKVRKAPQMAPMVAALTDADMANLGAYYQSLPAATGQAKGDVAAAKALYTGGDASRGIPACMSCHGPGGKGMPAAAFPAVAGQHAAYSLAQLKGFAAGTRTTDLNKMMRDIAGRLDEATMSSLAQYMAGLR
ncbi:MAG: cytochrome c4 [Chromatiales bacterium]|jgi:cytochrome c553|nr:cytochrome c4 [Chromatiales bacterium]